jgi:hypothetical protein
MKLPSKLVAVAIVAGVTVAVVRKYDLVNKGAALAEKGAEKATAGAEWATVKAVELTGKFLDMFAEDQTDEQEDEAFSQALKEQKEAWDRRNAAPTTNGGTVTYGDVR